MATTTTLLSSKRLNPTGWTALPVRSVPSGDAAFLFAIDRSAMSGATTNPAIISIRIEFSLDGGTTWGGTWDDPATGIQYPLWFEASIPDGQLTYPHTGTVVTTSSILVKVPPVAAVQARLSYTIASRVTIGLSITTYTAADVAALGL